MSRGPASRSRDVGEIAGLLAARARELAASLFPNGRLEGPEWCVGSLAGEAGRSLKIHVGRDRGGVWCDFSSGERGDALDLVHAALFSGESTKRQAIEWSLHWLGLDGRDPAALKETRRAQAAAAAPGQGVGEDVQAEARRRAAKAIFLHARASIRDTPAEWYLKGRGIDLARLGAQPSALRFHPALTHPETRGPHPCLVAAIARGADGIHAIHRTYLEVTGDGTRKLASVRDAKLTLGSYRGGAIRLWRGERADPKTGEIRRGTAWRDMQPGDHVTVTEGIEDALSVVIADPGKRVVAAVSLANMPAIDWPEAVTTITLCGQNDPAGSKAAELTARAIEAWQAQGRKVLRAEPPAGIKDINDLVRGRAA